MYINGEELPPTTWYPLYRYTKGAIYAPTAARIEGEPGPEPRRVCAEGGERRYR